MEIIGVCCIVGIVVLAVSFWIHIYNLEKQLKALEIAEGHIKKFPITDFMDNDEICRDCKYFEQLKKIDDCWWGLCHLRNYRKEELIREDGSCNGGIKR